MKNKFTKLTACLSLLAACFIFAVPAANAQTVLLNPASPFTVPAGVTQIKVECWGGGGAGGGSQNTFLTTRYGGGGGGGGYSVTTFNVTAGSLYTINYGAGGTVPGSNQNGNPGGTTTVFGPAGTISAFGGGGGLKSTAATGGAAGTGNTFSGGAGGTGSGNGAGGGGGAGSAGPGVSGTNGAAGAGGPGSPSSVPYGGGAGGAISNLFTSGKAGNAPGGGGGGGQSNSGTSSGGVGAAGQVIISYCTTYAVTSTTAQSPICTSSPTSNVSFTALSSDLTTGNYIVTYNRSLPAANGLTAPMTVSTAGIGSFSVSGLNTAGISTITVTNISSSSGACTNSITANNVTNVAVNQTPTQFIVGGGGSFCSGGNGVSVTLNGSETNVIYQLRNGGNPVSSLAGTGSGLTFTPITIAGIYTIVATHNVGGCTSNMFGSVNVVVNPLPVISTFTNSSPVHCIGTVSSVLAATGTVPSTGTLFTDNFNGTPTFAVAGSNSGGGTIFSQRASGYAVGALTTITNNDASSFMIASVNAFGSATTNSTLTSAVVNTTSYTSLNLSFRHSYGKGSEAGVSVQVSTDGGTNWSNISTAGAVIGTNTYTANVGANNNFVAASINLGSFINNANLRIRFNYTGTTPIGTFWWAIDDVTLNGQFLPLFSYAASTGAGVNGLPGGSSTPLASNKTITVNPTVTTTYTLTEQDPVTSCSVSTTTTVTVNQNSTLTLTSGAPSTAQTICMPGTLTDITYAVGGGGTGASITAGSLPAGLTASFNAGVFKISGTPTAFGNYNYTVTTTGPCINVSLSGTLVVNTAPTLSCPPNVTINTDPGVCLATRTYSATATGFPAPNVSYLVNGDFIDFPYDFPLGVTTVDVLAEGACAPDASCSFTVTVEDHEAPTPDLALLPDVNGECSATVIEVPTATDPCDGAIIGATANPLTYNVQGIYTVTWTFTDSHGNVSTQPQTVIVDDITAPVPDIASLTTATGECSVTVVGTPTATDNCVGLIIGTTTDPLTYNSQGTFDIHWSYNDGNGNVSSQIQTVVVDDITAPVANVTNLPNATDECSLTVSAPTATDNCVGLVTGTTTDPLTYNSQGTFTINWTYNDGNGNASSQTQTVIIHDITAPVPNIASLPTATGECSVTLSAPTATDNCVGLVTGTTIDPLSYTTQGTFIVHWNYDDSHGNISSQTQTVIVHDITAPIPNVASLPNVSGECSATVNSSPTANDNCVGTVTGTTADPLVYNTQGTFIIHWNYDDGNGNISSQTQTVIVHDITAPVPNVTTLPAITGSCSASVSVAPIATDNCVGSVTGTTVDPLTYSSQGTFTIHWTYNDGNGNVSTQNQTVVVNDATPPVINCPATQTFCATLADTFTVPVLVATDNCTISSTSYQISGATSRSGTGNDASGLFNPGSSTILWTVVDGNNNSSTCSTTVNVNQIPLIPTVTGVVNVCPYLGTGDQLPYTASAVGATNYTWTIPANVNVISGVGTSTLTLSFNNAFSTNGNQQLRVRAINACGISPQAIYYLLTQYPSTPNPISGPTNVCTLINTATTATYSIPRATSAVAYLWTGPTGTTITHPNGAGINDTIINVTYGSSFSGGPITVFGVDSCGTSGARTLNIPRTSSSTPGLITGSTNVCANMLPGGSPGIYYIRAISGATSYAWTIPAGSVVTHPNGSGPNDTTITVQFPQAFNSGSITVSSTNGCGTSGLRSMALNKLNPATPSVIDVIQLGFCEDAGGRVYSYTLSSMPANAVTVQWTVPTSAGAVLQSGQGTSSITVSYPSTAVVGNVTAQAFNNCASSTIRTTPVKLPACPPPGFTKGNIDYQLNKSGQPVPLEQNKLEVKISPNPTVSDVALQVLTAGKERIDVRIIDMQGREFKRLVIMPYQTLHVGSELKAGSYFIEIVQGEKKITQKLVKF